MQIKKITLGCAHQRRNLIWEIVSWLFWNKGRTLPAEVKVSSEQHGQKKASSSGAVDSDTRALRWGGQCLQKVPLKEHWWIERNDVGYYLRQISRNVYVLCVCVCMCVSDTWCDVCRNVGAAGSARWPSSVTSTQAAAHAAIPTEGRNVMNVRLASEIFLRYRKRQLWSHPAVARCCRWHSQIV